MREGFDDFVRSRSTSLLRIAYLLTGDRHSAEDLVQEVLEQMYVKWRRIEGYPEAYARRALVNRSTNRWRTRGRRLQHDGGWSGERLGRDDGYAAPFTQVEPMAVRRWQGPAGR